MLQILYFIYLRQSTTELLASRKPLGWFWDHPIPTGHIGKTVLTLCQALAQKTSKLLVDLNNCRVIFWRTIPLTF